MLRKNMLSLVVVVLLVTGCGALNLGPSAPLPTAIPTIAQPTLSETGTSQAGGMPGWLTVYFTNPDPPDQTAYGLDRVVIADMNAARQTIDVTTFDLDQPTLVDALVAAKQRGVQVRIVTDQTNGSQDLPAAQSPTGKKYESLPVLQAANIPVVNGGRSNGLMHNKMVIIDGAILYMGSWNLSYNDTFRNNNNLLRITSQRLIANYQAKFNELFVDKQFGTKAKVGALTQQMTLDGVPVENYFSPVDNVVPKVVNKINGAQKSVKFMIFTFTHADVGNAMIARAKAGVKVEGVYENRSASQGTMPTLYCAGLPVRLDGNKYTMHHKVIILDDTTVITGSFNFTKSADEANDDNVLIITNPAVVSLYLQEFAKVYGNATTPDKVTCK